MPSTYYQTLDELLTAYRVGPQDWDLALFGDGSGQGWDRAAGWAVVSVDRRSGVRTALAGGSSHGTVNWAEVEPYLHAVRHDFHARMKGKLPEPRKVVVFTDSQVTAGVGSGTYTPKANLDLWGCVRHWEGRGYVFRWIWIPRASTALHCVADRLSASGEMYAGLVDDLDLDALLPG